MPSEIADILVGARDYRKVEADHPSYKWVKKMPTSNTTTFTPSTSGGTTIQFEVPAGVVWNPARTKLQMTITYTAQTGSLYNVVPVNAIPFSDLDVSLQSGANFAKFTDFNEVYRVLAPYLTSEQELDDYDLFSNGSGTGQGYGQWLRRSNDLPTTTNTKRYDNSASSQGYREIKYLEFNTTFNDPHPVHNIKIDLGKLCRHTILELDKNLVFAEPLEITFTVASLAQMFWTGTVASDAVTGAIAPTVAVSMTNVMLYLAVETDQQTIADVKQLFLSGQLRIPFEFLKVEKQNTNSTVTSANQDSRINKVLGTYLKRVYSWTANTTHSANTLYDISNISSGGVLGQKVVTFYTTLNSEKIQDFSLNTTNGEDYMALQAAGRLKNTCIFDSNSYAYNWLWVDMWENGSMANRDSLYQSTIQGLPIEGEILHSTYYDNLNPNGGSGIQVTMYKAIVVLREVILSAQGTQITQVSI